MKRRHLMITFWLLVPALSIGSEPGLTEVDKYIASRQYYKAISQLDQLLAKDQHNPQYQFNRALALTGSGQYDKAIAQYRSLIKAYPDLPESYNNLAVIYFQQGNIKQARAVLEQAIQAHAGYGQVYQNLQAMNAAKARDAYARALQMPASNKQQLQLAMSDKLVLQQAAIASVRPAPVTRSALRYQANNADADKKSEPDKNKVKKTAAGFTEASSVLQQWARAWTDKNVSRYIGFYSDTYSPPGMTRKYWQNQRHERINKPKWLKVKLRDIELHASRGNELVIRLVQEYAADNYSDVTRKEFVMQRHSDKWQIIKERGMGYIAQ